MGRTAKPWFYPETFGPATVCHHGADGDFTEPESLSLLQRLQEFNEHLGLPLSPLVQELGLALGLIRG